MGEDKKTPVTKTKTVDSETDAFFQLGNKIEPKKPAELIEENDWLGESYDGQLSIDVFQTEKEIIIKSTIAGVKPEDIDISINKDMVTIRGRRHQEETVLDENYLYRECYWGGFSRSIILPTDIKAEKVKATLKNGILTVVLPKTIRPKPHSIKVKEVE